jgi:hypothetical protein
MSTFIGRRVKPKHLCFVRVSRHRGSPIVPEDKRDHHSLVVCLACTKAHFIHNSTGKVLGTQVE